MGGSAASKPLKLVICGSVDDGKSTLIGRLMYDCDRVFEDRLLSVERDSARYGTQGDAIDLALLADGLKAEREQGITIDVAYLNFSTGRRRLVVADAPGHGQYTHNMATAASTSDLAVILVDASKGVLRQTARHTRIAAAFGIRTVVLAVNKMDTIEWSQSRFDAVAGDFRRLAADAGIPNVTAIPTSALTGANLRWRTADAPWHTGPTLLEYLETVDADGPARAEGPFRMPVQYVNRPSPDFRGYCGRIASGSVRVGDKVMLAPSALETRVESIVAGMDTRESAVAGDSVTLTLSDDVDVSRGDVITAASAPLEVADQFRATLLWMVEEPLYVGRAVTLVVHGIEVGAAVTRIKHVLDPEEGPRPATKLGRSHIAEVDVSTNRRVPLAPYEESKVLGGFILVDQLTATVVGAGMVQYALRRSSNIRWQRFQVTQHLRSEAKHQSARCLWMTGLSGSGKSTLANLLEQRLHLEGRHSYVLDGDNVRHGLSKDLGFTEDDRIENIRRVAEVARLMVDAGLIVIVALISPFHADRAAARRLFAEGDFVEVFVDASIDTCEARDTKGLYAKARRGELPNFTGIGSPYEPPEDPEVRVDTNAHPAQECVDQIMRRTGMIGTA
ncbi:MAG: adenylyl-sulfate kinase [Spirochaetaceae bacterium]|nr:adenylyl-sulfate kinase [Spirochaetaceae bacterium]